MENFTDSEYSTNLVMNFTDILNSTSLVTNFAMDFGNCTYLCDNITDASPQPTPEEDEKYWEMILPRLRLLYIQGLYGEYYKLVFYVSLVVCIIGYISNILNVVVLSSTKMSHSMNLFLLVLSVADMFHITTQFSHIVHYLTGFRLFPSYQWVVFYKWNTYFETMFLYMTNWLAVSIGAWRYIAITWPLHTREWCSQSRAKIVIAVIIVLSIIFPTPIFAIITFSKITHRSMELYDKTFTEFAHEHNSAFLKSYWTLQLFMGFVPSIILALLTFGLCRNLYVARSKHRTFSNTKKTALAVGSHKTTLMLTILLILYILSNFPDGCMYLISLITNGDEQIQAQTRHFTDVIRVFMLSNNSTAFFIYYGLGEGFRKRFHRLFCCCFLRFSRERDESGRTTTSDLNRSRTSEFYITSISKSALDNPALVLSDNQKPVTACEHYC